MTKTNNGLVEYAKTQLGRPYWYGTFGNKASAALLASKRKQYPIYYTASDFASQFGQRVHDCVGLIKGYLWSETPESTPKYNAAQDVGANSMYNKSSERGIISTFPKVPGMLVYKGTATKKTHVGVYVGNDKVVEAKGHKYGVIESSLSDEWGYWGQCPFIEKDASAPAPIPTPAPTPAPAPTTSATYKVKTNTGVPLRLRSAPNTNSAVLTRIPNGTKVKVDKTSNGWAHTAYGGYTGWASLTYLKKV